MIDLFKLHDNIEDKNPYSWIVINGPELFINFKLLIDQITEKSNCSVQTLSRKVSKRIGCSNSMLYDILNGRTQWISLFLINNLLSILEELNTNEDIPKLKDKFLNSIEFLKSTPRSTVKIKTVKKLSVELAEFCGIHAADGSLALEIRIESDNKRKVTKIKDKLNKEFPELKISKISRKNKWVISFYITTYKTKNKVLNYLNRYNINFSSIYKLEFIDFNKSSMDYLKKIIFTLFSYSIKIKSKEIGQGYYVNFSNKVIGRYLKNIFNFPVGKKSDIVDAPKLIKKAPFNIQKAFVRGLIQFDGSVRMNGAIALSTNSKQLLSFFLNIVKRDKLRGIVWKRKGRENELGFESRPVKKWLTYFIKGTSKYQRLYEHIYGFTERVESMEKAAKIFDKSFFLNHKSTFSFSTLIETLSRLRELTRYQILDKFETNYRTILITIKILEKAKIVKIDRVKMFERFKGRSDKITFNPNIKEWRVAQLYE